MSGIPLEQVLKSVPSIIGVSEIVLNVHDIQAMREFYSAVMGFEFHSEVSMETSERDPDGEPTICFLKINDTDTPLGRGRHPQMLVLIDFRRHAFSKGRFDGIDRRQTSLNHLAFEIHAHEFETHAEMLTELKIEIAYADFPALDAKAMFFKDPEGNTLELICHAG